MLIALPDGRWLALDRETFAHALIAGAEQMAGCRASRQLGQNA
jgi:hypothetical protein